MQRKTIQKSLNKKFNDWLKSINDEDLRKNIKENTIITGGCITSMFLKERINDFDVYFTNEDTLLKTMNYYVNIFLENNKNWLRGTKGIDVQESSDGQDVKIFIRSSGYAKGVASDKPYNPVFLTGNSITLSNKMQIVTRFYGDAEEIHSNYDFVHCTNYWTSSDGKLYTNVDALEAILAKTLYYQGSKFPLCSVIRTRKFIKRGWKINAGAYLKMCFQISKMDLTDVDVLEDQLMGVDSAYFSWLIKIMKKDMKDDPDFSVDNEYICKLVDRVFN